MKHSPWFLKLVNKIKLHIREISITDVLNKQKEGHHFVLIDVREDHEWDQDHIQGAIHLGKGIIERDIEKTVPDANTEIVLYCGGGFRSAIAAESLEKMGYSNVFSMDGGIRAWKDAGFPLDHL